MRTKVGYCGTANRESKLSPGQVMDTRTDVTQVLITDLLKTPVAAGHAHRQPRPLSHPSLVPTPANQKTSTISTNHKTRNALCLQVKLTAGLGELFFRVKLTYVALHALHRIVNLLLHLFLFIHILSDRCTAIPRQFSRALFTDMDHVHGFNHLSLDKMATISQMIYSSAFL